MAADSQRVVLKFGSGILTRSSKRVALDNNQFEDLVAGVAKLVKEGHRPLVVSSGAAAAGMMAFGLEERPSDLATLQACCAVGQSRLMHFYETLFRAHGLSVAQVLLTNDDFKTPERREYVKSTVERLLTFENVVPIFNENDSVSVDELKFGDNDELSAKIAVLVEADQLIILTSVDGVQDEGGKLVELATVDEALQHVRGEIGEFSTGGMQTKLEAVRMARGEGISTMIANGRRADQLSELVAGNGTCTRFN
ncbi:MAG: glutamate 5-kinase [Verrucomicrobiota bacterium]